MTETHCEPKGTHKPEGAKTPSSDMLFGQAPAHLDCFGCPRTAPDDFRAVATLSH